MDKKQCSVMVAPNNQWGAFHQHKCGNPATTERDGKLYCKIHDPEYIKTKDAKRREAEKAIECPKCGSTPRPWYSYCPMCGTKYPNRK